MPEGQASRKPEQQAGPEQEQQAVPVREYRPAGHRSLGRSGLPIRSLRRISGKCASLFHNEGRIFHSPSALFDNKCRWPCFFLPYYPAFHGQSPNPRGTIVFYCIYEYYTSDGDTFQRQKPDSPNRNLGCQDMCYTLEFEKYSVTTWFGLLNARDVLAVPL